MKESDKLESEKKPNFIARRLIALGTLAAVMFGIGVGTNRIKESLPEPPKQSTEAIYEYYNSHYKYGETQYYGVKEGDSLTDVAEEVIGIKEGEINGVKVQAGTENIQEVIGYIESMPENKEVIKEGLRPNDVVAYPESVQKK